MPGRLGTASAGGQVRDPSLRRLKVHGLLFLGRRGAARKAQSLAHLSTIE
jgi:hypothetical protein